jgi:hypothetical protein
MNVESGKCVSLLSPGSEKCNYSERRTMNAFDCDICLGQILVHTVANANNTAGISNDWYL